MGLPMKRIHPAASRYQQCKIKNRHIHLKQLAIAIANCTRTNCRGGVGRSGNIAERWGEGGIPCEYRGNGTDQPIGSPPTAKRNCTQSTNAVRVGSHRFGECVTPSNYLGSLWYSFVYVFHLFNKVALSSSLSHWLGDNMMKNEHDNCSKYHGNLFVRATRKRERESGKGRERTSTSLAMSMSSRSGAAVAVAAAAAVAICQYYILLTQSNYLFANSLQLRTSDENTINIDDVVDNE